MSYSNFCLFCSFYRLWIYRTSGKIDTVKPEVNTVYSGGDQHSVVCSLTMFLSKRRLVCMAM